MKSEEAEKRNGDCSSDYRNDDYDYCLVYILFTPFNEKHSHIYHYHHHRQDRTAKEKDKEPIVPFAYAVPHDSTVMIKDLNAILTG